MGSKIAIELIAILDAADPIKREKLSREIMERLAVGDCSFQDQQRAAGLITWLQKQRQLLSGGIH